jgi:hypothetical protein
MLKVKLKGLKEALAAIKAAKEQAHVAVAGAVYVAANEVMTDAKQRAPVDTGVLRSSGYVTLPTVGSNPRVELGFGGAAEQYALVQHERTEFKHEVGEAKYLENAFNSVDVAGIIEEEVERRMESKEGVGPGAHRTEPE